MKKTALPLLMCMLMLSILNANGQEKQVPPELTEFYTPEVEVITPGKGTNPPSDAIILFDGKNLQNWESEKGGEAKWKIEDGAMTVSPGSGGIKTKQKFSDIQLHIEWRAPVQVKGEGQGRGNSGVFLQERYEVQVLDNYKNKTYVNGQAGSIYKQQPPMVNACLPPGEWQTYDIVFIAPRFTGKGDLASPGRVTVIHNGVIIQHYTEIKGPTTYRGLPKYEAHEEAPLFLQDHGDLVSFRNIWVREL